MFPHSWNHRVLRILTNQKQVSECTKTFNTSLTGHKVIRDDCTKMSELHSFLSTVLKIFITILIIPIEGAYYCYYYYSYYYYTTRSRCYYYYYYYSYYSYSSSAGTIAGAVVGGVVGFLVISSIVVFVCVKVCKKTNHGQVLVAPQPAVSYISSTNQGYPYPIQPTAPAYPQPAVYTAPPSYSSYNPYPPPYPAQPQSVNGPTSNPT
uniref:Protein shisa-5-like n=1 Tax=Crassostrea virginica TaxID=6565 RepID=A0A8B8B0G9_CRAVI|nr:protein shisa-5-like [Crassostrea virginica]